MIILKSKNSGNGFGYVKLKIESNDDIWELYNLILSGDSIRSITYRKTHKEQLSGSVSIKIHKLVMTIIVKSTEYGGQSLRVSGFNAVENEHVRLGQHHTIELHQGSELVLYKRNWDWLTKDRLNEICKKKIGSKEDILILLIGNGIANMFLVSSQRTQKLFSINQSITKGNNNCPYKDSKNKFFDNITKNLISHVNLEELDNIILGGPGFYNEDYLKYLINISSQNSKDIFYLVNNKKHVFLQVKTSNAYKPAIDEILLNEKFQEKLKNTKAYKQIKLIENFQFLLATKPDNICYGIESVENALENNAIDILLITEDLLRTNSLNIRKKLANITELNNKLGGKLHIFSVSHNSGKMLENMSGIAAILRFPLQQDNQQDEEFNWFKKKDLNETDFTQEQLESQLQQGVYQDDFLDQLKQNFDEIDK